VTAKYLNKLKETAEYFSGSQVTGCVVSRAMI
jgi:molecular chaperone DnaK (HSP70)